MMMRAGGPVSRGPTRHLWRLLVGLEVCSVLVSSGCSDRVAQPSAQQLADFQMTEPMGPTVDMERVLQARIETGEYRAIAGDVLQLEMPSVADPESSGGADAASTETCVRRIGNDGAILLPIVGSFEAAGKTLSQIEAEVQAQYCPRYVKGQFPIYARVLEYSTRKVAVAGAVAKPGIYALRPDQMSLVALLMEAGGIVETGAAMIRIARNQEFSLPSARRASATWGGGDGSPEGRWAVFRSPAGGRAQPSLDRRMSRLMFKREGPLRTTGWLAVAGPGDVFVSEWLDVASERQTATFLKTLGRAMNQAPDPRLPVRLAELAKGLESHPPGRKVTAVALDSAWRVTEDGSCVTFLEARSVPTGSPSLLFGPGPPVRAAADDGAVETLALPVRGLNIPFADVPLREGDSVIVERSRVQYVSVLGLVRNPGNYPYPPDAQYNLAQAVGFAGGLDLVADPRYVCLYRLRPDGQVASVTIQLVDPKRKQVLTEALALPVRPGDIVSVEQTPRTRTNLFLDRVFRISLGLYLNPDSVWNNK
jgi:protein involved in polysaccharide export with SLBB domain